MDEANVEQIADFLSDVHEGGYEGDRATTMRLHLTKLYRVIKWLIDATFATQEQGWKVLTGPNPPASLTTPSSRAATGGCANRPFSPTLPSFGAATVRCTDPRPRPCPSFQAILTCKSLGRPLVYHL